MKRAALLGASALMPGATWAHTPIPGIGIFYSGALHPFVSPAHLIALLVLGLAIGQRAQPRGGEMADLGPALLTLLAAAVAGVALTASGVLGDPDTDRLLLVFAAVLGLTVAGAWRAPQVLLMVVGAAVVLAALVASAPGGVDAGPRRISLAGTGAAAALLVAYVAVMVAVARRAWLHVAVRVFGSWLAAAAVLVLALSFAPARGG